MSIWLAAHADLRISWGSSCRRASTLSSSSWSYSFEDVVVSTHRRCITVWWFSLNTTNRLEVFSNDCIILAIFRSVSITLLIWILSTVLVLIYSTQIKFFVNNSWILNSSRLIWSNGSLYRIIRSGLCFDLAFRMSKLQTNLVWWLWLIVRQITFSLLIHVSSCTLDNSSLWDSIVNLLCSIVHPFVLLSIYWLFWNVLIASLSMMV